jgi:hypothetical protein
LSDTTISDAQSERRNGIAVAVRDRHGRGVALPATTLVSITLCYAISTSYTNASVDFLMPDDDPG